MPSTQEFLPLWASPPGTTIRDALEERGLSVGQFAERLSLADETADAVLRGDEPISMEIARGLTELLGGSVGFWINRDCQYRDGLARMDSYRWVRTMPTKQMESFGWIQPRAEWSDRLESCLEFFSVADVDSWRARYQRLVQGAMYRQTGSSSIKNESVAAWLRQGEIQAAAVKCAPWNPDLLRNLIPEIRKRTRQKDPSRFIPDLQALCARAGVAVAVVRAPAGCPMSGVARFPEPERGLIVLSAKYLSDDHFWFTFFHEVGHLLLPDPSRTYLDELEQGVAYGVSDVEREADAFAVDMLVPAHLLNGTPGRRLLSRDVIQLSLKAGVSPGVVVGLLQHAGRLGYANLNLLKRRYRWTGATLEKA